MHFSSDSNFLLPIEVASIITHQGGHSCTFRWSGCISINFWDSIYIIIEYALLTDGMSQPNFTNYDGTYFSSLVGK